MRGVFALILVFGGAGLCLAILGGVPMPWEKPVGTADAEAIPSPSATTGVAN